MQNVYTYFKSTKQLYSVCAIHLNCFAMYAFCTDLKGLKFESVFVCLAVSKFPFKNQSNNRSKFVPISFQLSRNCSLSFVYYITVTTDVDVDEHTVNCLQLHE